MSLRNTASALAVMALLSIPLHFCDWPEGAVWKMLYPTNIALLIWVLIFLLRYFNQRLNLAIAHVSVVSLVLIHLLSITISPDITRSLIFTFKLALVYLVGYSLLRFAMPPPSRKVYIVCAAVLVLGLLVNLTNLLHDSYFKYATVQSILLPLSCVYFIFDARRVWQLLAVILTVATALTVQSVGFLLAIGIAFVVTALFHKPFAAKMFLLLSVFFVTIVTTSFFSPSYAATLRTDIDLYEPDGQNVKQRYLEWQALLNLLDDRAASGSGPGCINHYRSEYYHRLPKLNTIQPFDQNGYLALAGECGVLGLVCFIWMVGHYFRTVITQIEFIGQRRCALACLAGLTGAAVAHFFSSVHYNGVLLIFVLLLALIDCNKETSP